MKKKETELTSLFIIKDYDSGEPLDYYLTNNPYECEAIMERIDRAQDDDKEDEFYSPQIVKMKEDGYAYAFEEVVKKHSWLRVKRVEFLGSYEY